MNMMVSVTVLQSSKGPLRAKQVHETLGHVFVFAQLRTIPGHSAVTCAFLQAKTNAWRLGNRMYTVIGVEQCSWKDNTGSQHGVPKRTCITIFSGKLSISLLSLAVDMGHTSFLTEPHRSLQRAHHRDAKRAPLHVSDTFSPQSATS